MNKSEAGSKSAPPDNGIFTADNCWTTGRADLFAWLIDGEDYFRTLRESLEKAEHEILILGWDIDSMVELVRDEQHPLYPSPLGKTLEDLVERKPSLRVYVLSWDFALVFMLERELLPAQRFGWQDSERLHFKLDGEQAIGASHHQKVVVIDGLLGFTGGFDLTKSRWDSRDHSERDPRRINTDGKAYRPFHDVQAVVAGEPARRLRDLASFRWNNATGTALAEPGEDWPQDPATYWPGNVTVQGENTAFGLARTWTDPASGQVTREVEQLFLDMIACARHSIYIENQYFTSPTLANALADRLDEADGPQVLMVLPLEASGWLEQATMDKRRNGLLHQLCRRDIHNHLLIMAPDSSDLGRHSINVHAKIMIVDEHLARIGSANLSCRSMGLDSECDIVVDAADSQVGARLRADLIAEHVSSHPADVAAAIRHHGLLSVVTRFTEGPRRLVRLDIKSNEYDAIFEPLVQVADMEKPVEALWSHAQSQENATDINIAEDEQGNVAVVLSRIGWVIFSLLVLGLAGGVLWSASDATGGFDPKAMLEALRQSAAHPMAPLVVVPVFVIGSLLVAPVLGMIAICALLFSPWIASVSAIAGTLAAAAVNYGIGLKLGNWVEQKSPRTLIKRVRALGKGADAWSLAGLRLIPIAPFTIVNLLAGAVQVRLWDFLLGTLIGMGPGIVLICLSIDRARAALRGEPVFDPWIVAAIAMAGAALIAYRVWQNPNDD